MGLIGEAAEIIAEERWMQGRLRGERAPSREFQVDALRVREIRLSTGLSQARFARILDVHVGTLRNWEQGLREPTEPVRTLLRAIHNDPKHVLLALAR